MQIEPNSVFWRYDLTYEKICHFSRGRVEIMDSLNFSPEIGRIHQLKQTF